MWYAIFGGALQIFFTRGGLVAVSHANPKSNLAIAQERSAKVSYAKQHPQSMAQHFSNSIINKLVRLSQCI